MAILSDVQEDPCGKEYGESGRIGSRVEEGSGIEGVGIHEWYLGVETKTLSEKVNGEESESGRVCGQGRLFLYR